MSNEEAIANLVGLMTSFHLEIKALPDDLKCAKCRSVLKSACQMPCGCRFCRTCIDDAISRGDQFCPGVWQECGATPLSVAQRDYRANKSVLKLTAKCPHATCPCEYPLSDMEGHMRVCSSKNINCSFRELGYAQGAFLGEEMRDHSRILIGTVANINRDMDTIKRELQMKDEQGRHLENEMKLISDENESIKRENEVICDQVRQLSENLERDSAMVTVVTAAIASIRDEMEPIRSDIRSIMDQFDCMKRRVESLQMAVRQGQLDDWVIKENVAKTEWFWDNAKCSGKFGLIHAFELASANSLIYGELWISLRTWAGPGNPLLDWPFRGAVTVTVEHRDRREVYSRHTLLRQIDMPEDNQFRFIEQFVFPHDELMIFGLDLRRGVRVSCRIVPDVGQ